MDNDPPDPQLAARAFVEAMVRQGVPLEDIIDAMMVTAINVSARLSGAEAVALALHDIAADVADMAGRTDAPSLSVH